MFHCPICGYAAHARSSRYLSENTKERYHQCQNVNCSHTFKTMETFQASIVLPGKVNPAVPHPERSGQQPLWM
ncbi:phage transcriptional activator, Ogr/Delta [Edwardsiella tarda ATCC 23685]|uniref:DNA-binding transcriptional regulator n=2 Tax=Edwardsiella TaxID=635 RepID=A0A376DMR7_9GAMM|nr:MULTISPECIES: DNA-binding transcriptional regulator [Edwardsiella]EFE24501.1 phage transcriptional activator, Ogr/Delta [Edwardsiella tarda ATCC 23685]ELM3658153.1 DNA-binding transcriptional regulator [Edwardsiella piscicida]QPR29129.1 DNA-binding transcriptional regulator [Edwardsiella hoshinae]UCQ41635.1 DNA-binding transcriptional regulator [Edwardsiella piscicida]WGE28634.1 DNA-binding transcriptional regulator [Edwardsiella tarda]